MAPHMSYTVSMLSAALDSHHPLDVVERGHASDYAAALGYEPMTMYSSSGNKDPYSRASLGYDEEASRNNNRKGLNCDSSERTERSSRSRRGSLGRSSIGRMVRNSIGGGGSSSTNTTNTNYNVSTGRRRRRGTTTDAALLDVPKAPERHVTFAENRNCVHEVDQLEDLPAEFIWYSQSEYDTIKQANTLIVRQVRNGDFVENEEQTSRGLEHKQRDNFRRRRESKYDAVNYVMEEQDKQINRGVRDPDRIAKAYYSVTKKCQLAAEETGLQDAKQSINFNEFSLLSTHKKLAEEAPLAVCVKSVANEDDASITSATTNQNKSNKKEKGVMGLYRKMRRRASM